MLKRIESFTEWSIFASRWLLAPLYVGLIIGQICYSVSFFHELWHLGHIAIFGQQVPVIDSVTGMQAIDQATKLPITEIRFSERTVVAVLLGLVDMIMVANLVIMVLIGGYATFVSKLDLDDQVDRPAWLDHIDPGTLKTKLAGALVSISGIHLLQSFNSIGTLSANQSVNHGVIAWQVGIHVAFIVTTLMLAWSDLVFERKLKLAHDTEREREAAKEGH